MQRLHTTCSLNIYISVIPKQTAWEQLKVHYVELTFYIQYFMGCSINSCWKMTLNLFELICFDHKQAYVLFFCISVAISWYVKQQSQYLENTIFFSYTCCSPQIQVHAPGWTEMLTYLPQQLCVLKTELVLDKFFTDVTFDPCQATMCLGHVVGQARWYLSASRPHAGSAEFTRGGGEEGRRREQQQQTCSRIGWQNPRQCCFSFFRWAMLKMKWEVWCMGNRPGAVLWVGPTGWGTTNELAHLKWLGEHLFS